MAATPQQYNNYQFEGNLGADPELRHTTNSRVATVDVAIYQGKDRQGNPYPPLWLRVEAWGDRADILTQFRKGDRLKVLESKLKPNTWIDKQTQQKRTSISCTLWDFDGESRGDTQPSPPANYDDEPF